MFSLAYVLLPVSDTPPAEAIRSSLARFQRGRRGDLPEAWLAFHDETEELREEHEALTAARARMHDPVWKQRYQVRAGIEGTLSQGVRAFGMRRSRYIGLAKSGLQQVCIGAAMNVSRVVRWLEGRVRARTHVTRFAALKLLAA